MSDTFNDAIPTRKELAALTGTPAQHITIKDDGDDEPTEPGEHPSAEELANFWESLHRAAGMANGWATHA